MDPLLYVVDSASLSRASRPAKPASGCGSWVALRADQPRASRSSGTRSMIDSRLERWLDALLETPGLTSITDRGEARRVHVEGSLAGAAGRDDASRDPIVDVGSGGGSPGIPLACAASRAGSHAARGQRQESLVPGARGRRLSERSRRARARRGTGRRRLRRRRGAGARSAARCSRVVPAARPARRRRGSLRRATAS